jgi:hypothetical protein
MNDFGHVLEEWRRQFENGLTFSEMKRYLQLQDEHPELGWLDIATMIRPDWR